MIQTATHASPVKTLQVLVLDDDMEDFFFFSEACKKVNYPLSVTHLSSPRKLIEQLRSFKYDVLFLDMRMPMMSGIDCLRELRKYQEFNCLPVMVLTGSEFPEAEKHSSELGVKTFLVKPMSLGEMVEMLHQVIPSLYGGGLRLS